MDSAPGREIDRQLSSLMLTGRLIVDAPASGPWNMAVDEALLETAPLSPPTLRFYRWSQPTLSLGYFQSVDDRDQHPASRACPVVRRLSGGGALLHDHELTYSLVIPIRDRLAAAHEQIYGVLHAAILAALADWGLSAQLVPEPRLAPLSPEPFLCFQRLTPGDITLGSHKICGSAQRRGRQALLQHGGILLRQSAFAPELPGLAELGNLPPSTAELADQLASRIATLAGKGLEIEWVRGELTALERASAEASVQSKFANPEWTGRR